MVKFFGRTTKTAASKTTDAKKAAAVTETKPASTVRAASKSAVAPSTNGDAPARARGKRPPRRDWAAEAAATPAGTPLPEPTSLASTPVEDGGGATPAKRRRGTRGGRGRKKPGTINGTDEGAAAPAAAEAPAPRIRDLRSPKPPSPATLEEALALQASTLQRFAADVTATIKQLQASIDDLRERIDEGTSTTSNPRVAIFVDVPNLIYATERRKVTLDFGKVLEYFTKGRELVRASAYAPITDDPQVKLESQRFVQYFVGHPYRLITKPLKRFADGSMKANFDIELAIDILTMSDRLDVVVLMSGDGDFRRVVELVASRGVRVEVAAFSETAASELKAVADLYVDLGQHLDKFRAGR